MKPLRIDGRTLDWGNRTYVMGILNITPDSFSGDGLLKEGAVVDAALKQAQQFVEAGADLLDVGGESTRPGSRPLDAAEERRRVIPVVRELRKHFAETLISVDTYKAVVAQEALETGAQIINDVWALRADPDMRTVVARTRSPVILMHNRSNPASVEVRAQLGNAYLGADYDDLVEDVKQELMQSVDMARKAGVEDEQIILDPGIGFGKTIEHNLELIDRVGEIRALGFPILLGPSRKSFIGYTLDLPAEERVEGTAASVAVGIARGADIVRVHDVGYMVRVAKMTDAILRHKRL